MNQPMPLTSYRPRSMLQVPQHHIEKPRFPVIDIHNHSQWGGVWQVPEVDQLIEEMDGAGVVARVDLDGGTDSQLQEHLEKFRGTHPSRFVVFANCNWDAHLSHNDFGDRLARDLRQSVAQGAEGLKIRKDLGLHLKNPEGTLLRIDDERLAPLFDTAGELNIPVLIHAGDPMAFFEPFDHTNERYEELAAFPSWQMHGSAFPSFNAIQSQLTRMLSRHPGTRFIGAHVASLSEDLARAAALLDRHPNLWVDISARTADLGRQPYTARTFFEQYRRRILFGLDLCPGTAETYRVVYRLLETRDEYFPYWDETRSALPPQGRWHIYGLGLDEEVLRNVYFENALTLIPKLQETVNAARTP